MRRVMILGSAGSGKSTLARRLAAKIGAEAIHLDALYWNPGWQECPTEEFRRRVAAAHVGERWVSDGNYSHKSFDLRAPLADTIIWLNQPRWLCLWRASSRAVMHWGRTRIDMGPDCPDKFDWPFFQYIWAYEGQTKPRHEAVLAAIATEARVVRLAGDREAAAFVAEARAD